MAPEQWLSGSDTALLIVPMALLLALWMFGLDERLAAPGQRRHPRRFGQFERDGQIFLTDPDGNVCSPRRSATRRYTACVAQPGTDTPANNWKQNVCAGPSHTPIRPDQCGKAQAKNC